MVATSAPSLLEPARLGALEVRNRIVRAGTSETMAGDRGAVTDAYVALYETLARNDVGLIFTGHLYCALRGRYARRQTGIHADELVPGLRRVTDAVHRHGGRVFAQVAHAGSQSRVRDGEEPLAPSAVANALTGRRVPAAGEDEIAGAVGAFAEGARRAVEAGFDGVHIHAANGYLISELSSPVANQRTDGWGGSPALRDRFALEVVRAVRAAVPADMPVTLKLGMVDAVPGGLDLDESVPRAARLVEAGLDGLEISCGLMRLATDSARQYVAVDRRRAAEDLLVHRLLATPAAEAYFLPCARAVRAAAHTRIVLVGGMRTTATMERIVRDREADFVALARPLIREPDLVRQIIGGRTGRVDCTSCNLCLLHEGHHALRCWRTPRRRLAEHALYRLRGGLRG
ncbi:MAG TPA: NADH:flavin oxidoreductase [Solirubrobacteraceae bacterium]|jgi:2,4-dienoyl-CoA reductase-like NADH-dependent reductase (Old Yellow Enzyme family)|nr:NADH:flavin oxidoreductase [Solirubrobacteraceae bacterium]